MSLEQGFLFAFLFLIFIFVVARLSKAQSKPLPPKPPTALVCGATGVGKSTLINTLVRKDATQTGIGAPVTQNTVRIESPIGDLVFYDSKGLEVEDASQTYLLLMSDLLRLRFSKTARDQIDLVLMCIPEPQGRIDDAHLEIAALCEDLRIPYGIALTKAEGNPALRTETEKLFPSAAFILPVRSLELRLGSVVVPAEGLGEIVAAMRAVVNKFPDTGTKRSRMGKDTQRLADLSQRLASNSSSDWAWVHFAENSWQCLGIVQPEWKGLMGRLRGDVKKILVPSFMKRTLNTSFDNSKIDGAIARRIIPLTMQRFSSDGHTIQLSALHRACEEAAATLRDQRPYRARFWS